MVHQSFSVTITVLESGAANLISTHVEKYILAYLHVEK